jgi:beta-glucanase (GH16 family)
MVAGRILRVIAIAAASTLAGISSAVAAADRPTTGPTLTVAFDGSSLDSAQWNVVTAGCKPSSNVAVANGLLRLGVTRGTGKCVSFNAEVNTKGKLDFRYGKVAVRLNNRMVQGSWGGFVMYGDCAAADRRVCGEIDVDEMTDWAPNTSHQRVWTIDATGRRCGQKNEPTFSTPLSGTWHTYWVDREPGVITIGVDNVVTSVFRASTQPPGCPWPYDSNTYYVNLGNRVGGWGGTPNVNQLPTSLRVDWVRYWQH